MFICIALAFIFIRHYANKTVKKWILILSGFFLYANLLLIFTLPYEIDYYKIKQRDLNKQKENNFQANVTNIDAQNLDKLLTNNYSTIFLF